MPSSPNGFSEHQAEVSALVHTLLSPVISAGAAYPEDRFEGNELIIAVGPLQPRACAFLLRVPPEPSQVLELEVGNDERTYEIWQTGAERIRLLEACVTAILRGQYWEEWKRSWWLVGLAVKFIGHFSTSEGDIRYPRLGGQGLKVKPRRTYASYLPGS